MDISKDKASIEAILFISGEPVPISKLLKTRYKRKRLCRGID